MEWIYLIIAIAFELIATTMMKLSIGFTKMPQTIACFLGYAICFAALSVSLKKIDMGVAYAIWGAAGITVMSIIGIIFFKESLSVLKVFSILFIVLGVVGLNLSGAGH